MQETTESSTSSSATRTWKAVFTVLERDGVRPLWLRIGTAYTNRDGSLTLRLDALPVNGMLQVRDPDPARGAGSTGGAQ
ncbi:MAG: hypothetical protein HY909_21345 [Deltaproteobacteria bacterium]|nr:hypothetical protein [Deltaproteobacteria bacterium]